jgi:TPR repeat protein
MGKTDKEVVEDLMKRVEANDAVATFALGSFYNHGQYGLLRDREKATELWTQAAKLGSRQAHHGLGNIYHEGGDVKKAKFHREAAAMLGNELARFNLACYEYDSGNRERAVKHCMIAASSGNHQAMNTLLGDFELGLVSRNAINSTLTAYNNLCSEMRSEARDAFIRFTISRNGGR